MIHRSVSMGIDRLPAFTPKERMLNAYRGVSSDRSPVAPEFWYYYPAKLLGVDMIAFEREVPFWSALKTAFEHWSCEGWGAAFAGRQIDGVRTLRSERREEPGRFRETTVREYRGRSFVSETIFDRDEPSSVTRSPVDSLDDLPCYLEMCLSPDYSMDFSDALRGHAAVGESYLLEYWLGMPFFDWIAEAVGFERAVYWVTGLPDADVDALRARYAAHIIDVLERAVRETPFESFVIGCSASCNSLLGPTLWRRLDKPFIAAVAERAHALGRLLHIHFHGRSIETIADFVEIGVDCVCPFERPPGGDVAGIEGLRSVRAALQGRTAEHGSQDCAAPGEKVTFNGNVHTVETLIRGTPADVRREVAQIREAFAGSKRLIIGTGDQVGRETPEENIAAMIEEASP
jgi:hypothetical protein